MKQSINIKQAMIKFLLPLFFTFLTGISIVYAQKPTGFSTDIPFDPRIPTPSEFTGHEIGEWHVSHDVLYYYMRSLAGASTKAVWEEYGRSHENRPLGHLIISSPENIVELEDIRQKHLLLSDPSRSEDLNLSEMPLVIKLGYGVHGNEPSASNAALLVAHFLVAGQDKLIDDLLSKTIILLDPCLNPDGMQRHAAWVNSKRSTRNNPDPHSLEFNSPWPGARTNHYWFDLNRDYLFLQHPESVGRVEAFYKWRPVIVTDHHEMGSHLTFFFQPGVPSRVNPLISPKNQALTAEIANYHEKYLDGVPALYFARERFDDFYLGKGSSFPDILGSVGILFEQAGVGGHLRETASGLLSFPFTINNQVMVSFSTLEAGMKMREKLLESQRDFFLQAVRESSRFPIKGWVFSEPEDRTRTSRFIEILLQQKVKVYQVENDITVNNQTFKAGESYLVPTQQNQFNMIRSLFEPVKEFQDSIFYDVSTWLLPKAFNIPYAEIKNERDISRLKGKELPEPPVVTGRLVGPEKAYAYLFEWKEYFSPKALYRLLDKGLTVRAGKDEFTMKVGDVHKKFSYGTILVTTFQQKLKSDEIRLVMKEIAEECNLEIFAVSSAASHEGIDLGSDAFRILEKPKILMLAGNGLHPLLTGEIWHMLDYKYHIPVTMVSPERFNRVDLNNYNVLIITGSPDLGNENIANIKRWNARNGKIIAKGTGNTWLVSQEFVKIDFMDRVRSEKTMGRYMERNIESAVQNIPGAIFETQLDLTHPLCYGYTRDKLPVMKNTAVVAKRNNNIYHNPVTYTDSPLLSGYCSPENVERVKGNAFLSVHGNRIISIYDNTNFRGVWQGAEKIFMNAVFFSQML